MKMKALIVLGFVLTTFAPGCGGKEDSQATPKGAVAKFVDGLMKLDKSEVLASVTGDKQELEALSVFMDYAIAVRDFQKAVIDEYGVSGWADFENEGGAKLSLDIELGKELLGVMTPDGQGIRSDSR